MSHPLYNPYASGNQSSSQGQYGHSSVAPDRDPRRTSSHLGPGSNFSSSGVSSATPANSGGTIPSLLSLPVTYIPKQRRPVLDKEIEGSVDMHISRAREEVRHQPVSQGSRFTGTQTGGFASASTGDISYPMPSASQGQRHSDVESGSSSLDWLQDYKRDTEDDSSRYYSTSASCSFPGSDVSRFNASSGRERGMQSIPGLGDYDYPGPDKPAAPTESSRPKYTSESAANILLHFGLEKEDLEHLISFPENQITPDNLPFILRQIRIQKAKKGTTADQSKPYPEPQPTTSQSSSRGAGMHLDEMSSTVLQPSKVIDYGHTSKYTAGVVDEIGRTTDNRENSGGSGSMFQMNPYSSGSHKSGTSVPSRDPWGSGASLSSSYSSMQSSATPPSSDPTKRLKTQQDLTSQTTFSFPLPKKDTDIRLFKPEIPNPLLTQESRPDKQPVSKTEPSGTLVRGGNTSRPGILRLDGHDKSSSKDQSSTKGQGLKVAEQIKKQQMQPKQSEPQPKQPVQQPKQPVQQPKQSVQQQPVRQQQPVLQMGQTLHPQGFPAARPVPPPSFIPSSSSTSHSILPPVFVGVPRPLVVPPALPQPVPGLMNFLHMQMPPSSNQRGATGEVSRSLPSAAMMHDYAAASPRIFPHTCTLCNKECSQMKDWISHQNTSIHLENCKLLRKRYPQWDGEVPSLPRAPGSDAKPSPSSSAQTYQDRHQRSGHEISSRSRSSRSRSRSYSPVRHHGSESRRNRRSSRSRSRSYSPRRYYGSESRREKRSRSRSPYSSRYTRRSRSNSPRYDRPTSSRYRSRSRSRERRSSPRRREKRRERRSSSERSSPHRKRSSSTEMLAKKLLQTTAVQSLSSQSDLETVVKTLAPALLAELAKMKSSSSSSSSSASLASSSNAAKSTKAKQSLQKSEASSSTKPKVVKCLPPTMVRLQGVRTSLSHGDVVAAVEQFGKTKSVVLFRSKVEAVVCFENAKDAEKLRSFNSINMKGMPVTIVREEKAAPLPTSAKEPTKPPEQKSMESTIDMPQSTKFTPAGTSSSLPSAADKPKTGKLVAKAKVLVSKAKKQQTKQTVKKTKAGKVTAKGAVKAGAYKVLGSKKVGGSGKGEEVKDSKVLPEKPSEMTPPARTVQARPETLETKQKDAVTTQKDAASTIRVPSSLTEAAATMSSSAAVPAQTVGDEIGKHLCEKNFRFIKMPKCLSSTFEKTLLFLNNLPKYEDGCYTEQDVADLLVPFGFQYEDDYIYVIPQTRMAFALMPGVEELQNVLKAKGSRRLLLKGSKVSPQVVNNAMLMDPLGFYKSLMKVVRFQQQNNDGTRMIFIKNISPSEARDLRKTLTEITSVRNYLPLLNKVFIEFDSDHDADRLGFWYSRLKQDNSYKLYRIKIPEGTITPLPSRLEPNGVLDRRDVAAGATVLTTRCGVPQGSTAPFWVTMRTRPFVFPTMSPWFIIPDHVTLNSWKDFQEARIQHSADPTVMLTNLPGEHYSQEVFVELLRCYFPNLHSELHSVTMLTLQRRAFVFFNSWGECLIFAQNHFRIPVSFGDHKLGVHFVLERMDPGAAEEVMYRNLMKWSNVHVPELESLEDRLLSVEISETTMDLIMLVMHLVSSIASFISFLPLANRILIEMSEPSGVTKVAESASQHHLTAVETWKRVGRVESVRSLNQRRGVRRLVVTREAQPRPSNPGSESITAAPADVEMKDSEEKPSAQVTVDSRIPPKDVKKEVKSESIPGSEVSVDSKIPPENMEKVEDKKSEEKPASEVTVDSRIPPQDVKKNEKKPSAEVNVDSKIPPKNAEKEVKTSENKPRSEVSMDSRIPPKDVQKKSEQKPASEVTVDSRISPQDLEKSEKNPSAEVSVDSVIPPKDVEKVEVKRNEEKPRSEVSLDSRIPPKDVEKEVKTSENKPRSEVSVDSRIPPENMEQEEVKKSEEKPASQVTVDSKIPPEKMDEVEVKDEASAAASVCSADGNTVAAASSSDPSATREVKTKEAELPTINEDVFKVIAAAVRQHRLALRGGTPSEDRESSNRNSTSSKSVRSEDMAQEKDPTDFTASVDSSDFFSLEEQTFNLEDFVTVDEIIDDDQSSSSSRRTSRDRRGRESSDAAKQTSTRSSKDSKSSASSSSSSSKPTKASVRSSSSSSSKSVSPKRHQDSSEPSRSHIQPSAAGRTSAEPPASSGHRAHPSSTKSPARASQSSSSGCRTRSAKTAAGSHQSHREEEKPTKSAAAKSDHQVSAESAAAKTVESEMETEASSELLPPAQRQDSEVMNGTRSLQTDLKNESLKEVKMSKERKKEEADKHTEEQQEEEEEEDYQILDSVDEQTDEQTTEENPDEAQSEQRLDDGGQQVLDRVEEEGGARPEEGNASVRVLESITEDQEAAVQDDQCLMEVKQPTEKNPSRAVDGSDKSAAEDSADQNQDTRSRKSPRSRGRRTKDKEMPSEESCKASKDAGRSPDSEEKPPEGRDDKDASTYVSEQGTFDILDSVEDQTRTEGDDQKLTADTTTEEDLFQVIYSVEDQPETESESNNKEKRTKRGEAAAKRDDRPTRRTPRTRTSQSEDKEKSPKKADRTVRKHETRTKDSAAGKDKKEDEVETLKKMVYSVDGASTTERSGRRRSPRGNKEEKKTSSHSEATENPDGEEEITYEILDSVEDEAAVDEPTVSTRSTRGRSQRTSRKEASNPTKDDTRRRQTPARDSQKPNEEKAAAKERTPTKKSGAGEEEATYEILDSVEDDQPPTGGKPRRGRPKKDVKTAKKPKKAAKEEEEEATYQVLDSVGDETVEDQRHTEESKSPRKSTVCEDDGRNTKKSSASMMDEEEEEPMYQIVDSLEDDQEEKTNTEESDGRTTERSWTKDEGPAAETGDLEPGGTSAAEPVEENLQHTAELHPAAAENKEQSPEPDEAPTENKQEAAAESSLNLDEVSEEEEDYPDDGTEEEELKKKQAAVAMTTGMAADGQQLLTLDEVGGDGDGRCPEITEGELQELVTLDEICEEEEGKAELSVPEPRPLSQESQSEASSNPQAADEEEEKTSKCVKRKHEDDDSSTVLEQSVNFVTVDEVGDAEDEEKEEKEALTPRTRGRAKKRSRQSAVRKSTRGKTETPEEEGSVDSSAAQSEEPLIQRTEVEAASGAQEEAASAGQQLEGRLEEKEGRSTDADNKRRKQLIGPEAKKPRCQSPGGEFSLPPFSSSPLGVEFVVPKSGFFCELCSVFYLNEISAKETHCSSQRHYHNLEKHYQKLKQKLSGTENPQSSD